MSLREYLNIYLTLPKSKIETMDYVLHVTAGILKHLSYFAEVRNKFQMTALTMQSKARNFAQLWETLSCLHYSFPLVT